MVRDRDNGSPLSRRETELIQLMVDGRPTGAKRLAKDLGIEVGTARNHTRRILGKLGAMDRTQAVVIALREGYINISQVDGSNSPRPSDREISKEIEMQLPGV